METKNELQLETINVIYEGDLLDDKVHYEVII